MAGCVVSSQSLGTGGFPSLANNYLSLENVIPLSFPNLFLPLPLLPLFVAPPPLSFLNLAPAPLSLFGLGKH
eukprot:552607-Pelagomonas_calceolata.AAC.1